MKKTLPLLLLMLLISAGAYAQDCQFYFPQNQGVELVYKQYDKKNKETGSNTQKVTSYKETSNGAEATIHTSILDKDGKNVSETELQVKCENGVFYFDMESYLNQQAMSAYENMEIKLEVEDLEMPSNLSVGQELKSGFVKAEIYNAGFKMMTIQVDVTDRKVEAKEDITTPAGTYTCFKISQTVSSKMGIKVVAKSTEWMHPGLGLIKSESYSKDGKLTGSTVLVEVNK